MKNSKDVNYYKKLNYNVILKKIDSNYYLFIPELSLIVQGKSLDEAYGRLEIEKENCFKKAADMDVLNTIKEPEPVMFRKKLFVDLAMFFTKTLIIISICSAAFIGTLPFVNAFVANRISGIPGDAIKGLVTNLSYRLNYKLNNMTEEDKEKMKLELRKTIKEIKPFVDEIKVLFKDE
jgi:predicted RNase H-like HicB family nuclease